MQYILHSEACFLRSALAVAPFHSSAHGSVMEGLLTLQVLEMTLRLMVTELGSLDPAYFSKGHLEDRRINMMHVLTCHLSHPANAALVGPLHTICLAMGPAATCALRLMCRPLFRRDDIYLSRARLAHNPTTEVLVTHRPQICRSYLISRVLRWCTA
jgi:hypothetical protein